MGTTQFRTIDNKHLRVAGAVGIAVFVGASQATIARAQDVESRRASIRAIERASQSAPHVDMLVAVEGALRDPDTEVARTGAVALNHLVRDPLSGQLRDETIIGAMVASGTLMQTLTDCINHQTFVVKAACLDAVLVLPRPLSSQVIGDLLAMSERDPDAAIRQRIVSGLPTRAGTLPAVGTMLVNALRDKAPQVQRTAALTIARVQPPGALPVIATELPVADRQMRMLLVDAMVSYGEAAKPYVNILQGLSATETEPARKDRLDRAIRQLSAPSR